MSHTMKMQRMIMLMCLAAALAGVSACAEVSGSVPQEMSAAFMQGRKLYVTVGRLNLRQCPFTDCRVLRVLARGDIVLAAANQKGWSRVRTASGGVQGWVATRYLATDPNQAPPPARKASEPPALPREQWGQAGDAPPPVKEQFDK